MPESYFAHESKIKTHAQMLDKLRERAGSASAPVSGQGARVPQGSPAIAAPEPAVRPQELVWEPPIPGLEAIVSTCGRFSIARSTVMGVKQYQAWSRLPTPERVGEHQPTAEGAKQVLRQYLASAHAQASRCLAPAKDDSP